MKRLDALKPSQLAWLTILSGILQGSIFLIPFFHTPYEGRIWIPVAFVIFIGGTILTLKSISTLKDGIQNGQWPAEQIDPLRAIVESPFMLLLLIALFGAFAALNLLVPHSHSIGWAFYMPSQALSQLTFAFRQKAKKSPTPNFQSFAPINSTHWGRR